MDPLMFIDDYDNSEALSLANKGNCHLKWDHHNNKKLWIALLNSRVQAVQMFASMKDSFNYTLYATLTDNSIKLFFSIYLSLFRLRDF